ncbi:uncharacterized protein LOC115695246 [Cannabis sativa]|uniref:uncharacterized protein LOC115695246 n=1 Tax=Cannabis sativa TaxID=3483 RepID=UPI0011E05F05|nr:uncharacterized protein LOC115695246 [Cannabis sativa]
MEKAFDRVEWDFLLAILDKFKFPIKFISLIHQCISSTTIRFSINGHITSSIHPSRGIRQGNPLSPYIFLLCSEGLTAALRLQELNGSFRGISVARNAPPVSHLLFADDTLLFTVASPSSCNALKEALNAYHLATGQKVNYTKSSILFSPNTPTNISTYFFDSLGLESRPFISKYLGVPQCFGRSKKCNFDFLLQKVSSQLSIWNGKLFSKAVKEVLLKAVIQAIPSYTMSCFRSLISHNQAMPAKQTWRVFSNPNSLLANILKAKYFRLNGFLEAKLGHSPSYTWSSLLWGRDLLIRGLLWKVGNGCSIRTLQDPWIPGIKFPCLRSNALPPIDKVSFFIDNKGSWDKNKLYQYFDDYSVLSILKVPIGGLQKADSLIWNQEKSGIFSVKSAYHIANNTSLPPSSSNSSFSNAWWKTLWTLNIQPKIKNFSWRVFHHILPVGLNLFVRKTIPQPSCSFCTNPTETVTHALLDCPRASKIWKASPLRSFYFSNRHVDVKDFMMNGFEQLHKDQLILLLTTLWAIWHSRNKKLFANLDLTPTDIIAWINTFISDYQSAVSDINRCSGAHKLQVSGGEKVVPQNQYLLRTDAAINTAQSRMGFGVVVRDWQAFNGRGFVFAASLEWCINIQIPLAVVETDSKMLVDKVHNKKADFSALSDVVEDIRCSLSAFPDAHLRHINKTINCRAHNLARRALGQDEESCWNALIPTL